MVMQYTTLGRTGLEVSRLCLGCLNFGSTEEWMMNDRDASIELIERALDLGINFFDTANAYSRGESEAIVGDAIEGHDREELVLATKVFFEMGDGPNKRGLSRKHVLDQVEGSLDRLGTDYIDLYQIHRWDENTPIEETLSTLDYLIESGTVRYVGASTMAGWKFSKALYTADRAGWERFVCMQPEYNLVDRHEEANLLPICAEEGIGVIPWSPLAGGFLAGKYERGNEVPEGSRAETDEYTKNRFSDANWKVLNEVRSIAEKKTVSPAQVSLAWLLQKDVVDAPIVGPRRADHLEENVEALAVELTDDEIARLEAPIFPQWPARGKD
jgi:aryl-alcohol dehydrogenase-like predicted oxidoreductase